MLIYHLTQIIILHISEIIIYFKFIYINCNAKFNLGIYVYKLQIYQNISPWGVIACGQKPTKIFKASKKNNSIFGAQKWHRIPKKC